VEGRNVDGNRVLASGEATLSGGCTANGYRISGVQTPEALKGIDLDSGFTVNAVVSNVGDGNRREVAFLGNGIHRQKGAQENLRVLPLDGKPRLFAVSDRSSTIHRADGILYATGFEEAKEWNITVTLTDSAGKVWPLGLPPVPPVEKGALLAIHYDFDLAAIPDSLNTRSTTPNRGR